jgi:hypothetical protein
LKNRGNRAILRRELIMLEKEQEFYIGRRDELRAKYLGKRIVIEEDQILGVYESDAEALEAMAAAGHKLGTFMVKYIPLDPEDETLSIYSPLAYA